MEWIRKEQDEVCGKQKSSTEIQRKYNGIYFRMLLVEMEKLHGIKIHFGNGI
jgi:hypothetical protein